MMKSRRILLVLLLLVAYFGERGHAARGETLPGATRESLQQQLYRAAADSGSIAAWPISPPRTTPGWVFSKVYPEAAKWFQLAANKATRTR